MVRKIFAALVFAVSLAAALPAAAQLNNEPFSFNTPDGGPGMSSAAREAIFRQELFGQTPDHIARGPGGTLLNITPGPGGLNHLAIVRAEDGSVLESYRGRGLDLAGFLPFLGTGSSTSAGGLSLAAQGTHLSISGWTLAVFAGSGAGNRGYVPPMSGASIDMWTSQVYGLSGS